MLNKFIADESKLKLFFSTMYERQLIWYKRFVLKLPREQWTNDKLYSKYRFTNVYRELDRASQYLLNNIILNKNTWCKYTEDEDNYINLIWKILFFRMINNPNVFKTTDIISDYNNYNADEFYNYLKNEIIENNITIAHGAFCQYSKHDILVDNKLYHFDNIGEYFAKFAIARLHDHIKDIYQIMKESFNNDKSAYDFINYMSNNIDGCGKFIAHEFFQDLCYIKEYTGLNIMKYDANSATNAGPGSTAGSKYIFSNVKSQKDVIEVIEYLRDIAKEELEKIQKEQFADTDGFYYVKWDIDKHQYIKTDFNFTLNQIEMWLCEYYKYIKYLESEGKVRVRLYNDSKPLDTLMY